MRKTLLIFLGILCLPFISKAQTFDNTWIDFSKTYYKFQTENTGIHRISYSALQSSGIDLNGSGFKLIYKGEQIPIYTTTNGTFGPGDYIEFFGQQNDGEFDTQLFADAGKQLQVEHSLFTDESTYFLISDNTGPFERYENETNDISNAPAAEDYFMYESILLNTNTFHFGEPYYVSGTFSYFSTFDEGEGWVSSVVRDLTDFPPAGTNTGIDFRLDSEHLFEGADVDAQVTARVVGRNKSTGVINDKHLQIYVDDTQFADELFSRFEIEQYAFDLPLSYIETVPHPITGDVQTKINFKALDGVTAGFPFETRYSLAKIKMEYPRAFNFNDEKSFKFNLTINETKYFEIEGFDGGSAPVLYDMTNKKRIIPVISGGVYKFKLEQEGPVNRTFYMSNTDSGTEVLFNIDALETRNFVDYSNPANQGDYLIITHSSLMEGPVDQVERYADYRASMVGGSHEPVVADIDQLYDQFAWGIEKHPMSIKNFINFAYNNFSSLPQHVLILGKGVNYEGTRNDPEAFDVCLVPPYGYTASDLMFTTQTSQDYYSRIAIGRVPAKTPDQIRAYLDKVIKYEGWYELTDDCETITDRAWMKNMLHISKGWGQNETDGFQNNLDVYEEINTTGGLGYELVGSLQDTRGPIPSGQTNWYFPAPEIAPLMEEGLAFINYVGHSSPFENYWQYDMQHPSNYNNDCKYPFILSNSCFVGKINDFSNQTCMAEDYILFENGGAIGFLAAVALSSPGFLHIFSSEFSNNISNDHYGESNGRNVMYTIQDIYNPTDDGIRIVCNEFTFAGDPAVAMYHWDVPELVLDPNIIMRLNDGSQEEIDPTEILDPTQNPSILVEFTVYNYGSTEDGTFEIAIGQYELDGTLIGTELIETRPIPAASETFQIEYPLQAGFDGNQELRVTLDGNSQYAEVCEDDNTKPLNINVSDACAGQNLSLDFQNLNSVYCSSDDPAAFSLINQAGNSVAATQGSLFIDGDDADEFNPSSLGVGTYDLLFAYDDPASGCTVNAAQQVEIQGITAAEFTLSETVVCLSDGATPADVTVLLSYDNALPTGESTSFEFPTGVNSQDNGDGTLTLSFSESGEFEINMINESVGGCSDVETSSLTLDYGVEIPQVECGTSSTEGILEFVWDQVNSPDVQFLIYTVNDGNPTPLGANATSVIIPGNPGDGIVFTLDAATSNACGTSGTTSIVSSACTVGCLAADLGLSIPSANVCVDTEPFAITASVTGGVFAGSGIDGNTFDPSAVGPGTYNINYEVNDDGCENDEISITVSALPNAEISGDTELCAGSSLFLLAPGGLEYNWQPGGADGQTIEVSTGGTYTLTVTNDAGCESTSSITVNELAPVVLGLNENNADSICVEDGSVTLAVDLAGGVFSGEGISNTGQIDPEALEEGIYNFTYTYNDPTCGMVDESIDIEIKSCEAACPPITLGLSIGQNTFCVEDDPVSLSVQVPGGTFNGTAINPNTGIFNPALAGDGTYTLSYNFVPGDGCPPSTEFVTVIVNENPSFTISGNTVVCDSEETVLSAPAGFAEYVWSPGGSDEQSITVIASGEYSVTVFTDEGCPSTETVNVSLGSNVNLGLAAYDNSSVCLNTPFSFENIQAGGNYTINGTGFDGTISPDDNYANGTYAVNYTLIDGDCEYEESINISIGNPIGQLGLNAYQNAEVCNNESFTFNVTAGGTFTLNGNAFDGSISEGELEPGNYNVEYVVTDAVCGATIENIQFAIADCACAPLDLGLNASELNPCMNNGLVALTIGQPGGSLTGAGVDQTNLTFDPMIAGVGQSNIQYSYTNPLNGCQYFESITIEVSGTPDATISGNTTICDGGSTMLSGPNGLDYAWSNDSDAQTINVTQSGTYSLTVTNDNGCQNSSFVEVVISNGADAGLQSNTNQFCSVDAPYAFTVTPGLNGSFSGANITTDGILDPSSLNVGNYSIAYSYADQGCTYSESLNIEIVNNPVASISGSLSICNEGSTLLTAIAGYDSYIWSPGNVESQQLEVSEPGEYSVTVATASGCSDTYEFSINTVASLDLQLANNSTVFCESDPTQVIQVAYSGGVWTGAGIDQNGFFSPVTAGVGPHTITYSYTNPSTGCTYDESLSINVSGSPSALISGDFEACGGSSAVLTAPAGGSTYVWSTQQEGESIEVFDSGTYSVTVTNDAGCQASSSVNVNIAPQPDLVIESTTLSICSGDQATLTGIVTNAIGNFTWETAPGIVIDNEEEIVVAPTSDQVYTVNFLSEDGCPATANVQITIATDQNPIAAFSTSANSICTGQSLEFVNQSVNSSGNAWTITNMSTGAITTSSLASPVFVFDEIGTYDVALAVEGCGTTTDQTNQSAVFTVGESPAFDLSSTSLTVCPGEEIQLSTSNANFTYSWTGPGLDASSGSDVSAIPSGDVATYTVVAQATSGCTTTESINIEVLEAASVAVSASSDLICEPQEITLTAFGSGNFTWQGEGLDQTTGSTVTAFITGSQSFSVTALTDGGCDAFGSVNIEFAQPQMELNSSATSLCQGEEVTLSLGNAELGTSYTWTGPGLDSNNGTEVTATVGSEDATYTVTATNDLCQRTESIDVSVGSGPVVNITGPENQTICEGDIFTLTADGEGLSYDWQGSGLIITEGEEVSATYLAGGNTSFSVTTIGFNNCSTTSFFELVPANTPQFDLSSNTQTVCAGEALEISTSNAALNYAWLGEGLTELEGSTNTFMSETEGDFTITVNGEFTDNGACSAERTINISVIGIPEFEFDAPSAVCIGSDISINVIGDDVPYSWSGANLGNDTGTEVSALIEGTQEYTVIANEGGNCSTTQSVTIDVFEDFNLEVSAPGAACSGEQVELSATGASTYDWSPGNLLNDSTLANPTAAIFATTVFTVIASDANGCSKTQTVTIESSEGTLDAAASAETNVVCAGQSFELSATGGSTYTWLNDEVVDPNAGTTQAVIFENTLFEVVVANEEGCTKTVEVEVTVADSPEVTLTGEDPICAGESVQLSLSGADQFTWDESIADLLDDQNSVNPSATLNETTEFNALITDDFGCDFSVSFTQQVYEAPDLAIAGDSTVCTGDAVDLLVTGGQSYTWENSEIETPNQANPTVVVDQTTIFTVEAVDINGCFYNESFTVTVDDTQDECDKEFKVPNVITPNGDGMNDTWAIEEFVVFPERYPNRVVTIYNRWGQMIYESNNDYTNQFDGTYENEALPEGTYYYLIDFGDRSEPMGGSITILKDQE